VLAKFSELIGLKFDYSKSSESKSPIRFNSHEID